ncbi:MAG TPA: MFS transporter [Baekduia sp.]|nr:MFS transporter [Baekduia sp.]
MSLAPLRSRPFRHLLVAYGINQLGDWAGEVALAIAVFALTRSPAAVAATWLVHRCVASLASPVLVARVEGHRASRVLPAFALIQATLFVAIAIAVSAGAGLPVLLAVLAADGVLAPAGRALSRTSVVAVTQQADLHREGNALINVVFTANGVLAPALGGALVAGLGPASALLLDAGTFVVAAAALATARLPTAPRPEHARRERALSRLRASVQHVRRQPLLARLFALDAVLNVLTAMIMPIEVVFITGTLDAGDAALGAVLTAWGAGMVAGGVALTRLSSAPVMVVLLVAAAATGAGTLAMGVAQTVAMVIAGSAIGGIGNGIYGMTFVTAFQERTAAEHQARVNGLYDMLISVMPGLGFGLGGVLAAAIGPRVVYLVSGAGCLAVVLYAAARLRGPVGKPGPAPAPAI